MIKNLSTFLFWDKLLSLDQSAFYHVGDLIDLQNRVLKAREIWNWLMVNRTKLEANQDEYVLKQANRYVDELEEIEHLHEKRGDFII